MELKYKSWKEITVNVYQRLIDAVNSAEITDDETLNNINKEIAMLAVLCECDEDEIAGISKNEFVRLSNESNFLSEMPKVKIQDKYTINGKKYEVFLSLRDMNMSQYIDFQTFYKDTNKYFKELLAIFLLPVGKKYGEGYNIEEVIDDIGNHLSIVDANSILFFFVIAYRSLTKVMLNYSIKQMRKAMKKEKNLERKQMIQKAIDQTKQAMNLAENGVGYIW